MFFYNELDSEVSQVQPTVSDPYFYNTSLLLKMDSDFSDSSVHQHTTTTGGNVSVNNSEFKYGGGSGYFDGNTNTGVSFSSSDSFDLRGVDWTMEAWIYPDGNYSDYRKIIAKRLYTGDSTDYQLYLSINTGELRFYEHGGANTSINTGVTPTTNQWTHVAAVRKDGVITIYVNGEAKVSETRNISAYRSGSPLGIGNLGGLNRNPFSGYIDDVRITKGVARYTSNFTPPDSHPTTGPSEIVSTDLQLHLDAGDANSYSGTGTTWFDLSGNNLNGTLVDGVTFDGNDGGSLVFDASNDHVALPKLITTTDFTVCQFIKPVSHTGEGWTFEQYLPSTEETGRLVIAVHTLNSSQFLKFFIGGTLVYSSTALDPNQVYFVACSRSATTGKIYINGLLDATNTAMSSDAISNTTCAIGGPHEYHSWRHEAQFIGNIYNTIVYNKALSDAEILQNFEVTKSRFGL